MLSGGERRRLALAIVVASGANFLILDEPTNHLDLESREALELALENFPATVLLVSHDRALLDAVAERTLAIEDGDDPELRRRLGGLRPRARAARNESDATILVSDTKKGAHEQGKPQPVEVSTSPKRPSELERVEAEIAAQEEPSPSSSGSSPTTGATSSCSPPTAPRATSSRRCSTAGRRSSSRRRR